MIWKLFKLLCSNMYNFGAIREGFKKGPKGIAKSIGLILVVLIVFAEFLFLFGSIVLGLYETLEKVNSQAMLPAVVIILASIISFFFGFLATSASYYTGAGEEQLMSLPLYPRQIFTAKFFISVLSELAMGTLLICIGTVVYGYKEGLLANPGIYIGMIVSSVTICSIIIFLTYLVFIVLLTVFPFLRKKNFLQGIATAFLLVLATGFGFVGGASTNELGAKLTESLAGSPLVDMSGSSFLSFISSALTGNWLAILVFVAIEAALVFGILPLLAKPYLNTMNGFSDVRSKKIDNARADKLIQEESKRNSIIKALYLRDLKTVLREPAFFTNGPLSVILMPAIFFITLFISFSKLDDSTVSTFGKIGVMLKSTPQEELMTIWFYVVMVCAAVSTFIGTMANTASTSFSREGKALHDLQAMPINPKDVVLSKFYHALTYAIISSIIVTLVMAIGVVVTNMTDMVSDILFVFIFQFIISILFSSLLIILDMFFDTIHPKLNWENPVAAVKQNINTMFSIFTNMILIALLCFLVFVVFPKNMFGILLTAIILIVVELPCGYFYFKYAVKRFPQM